MPVLVSKMLDGIKKAKIQTGQTNFRSLYKPFLDQESVQQIRDSISGEVPVRGLRFVNERLSLATNWLRFCPLCVRKDRANYGETYSWIALYELFAHERKST
jgi:hypothetical protein